MKEKKVTVNKLFEELFESKNLKRAVNRQNVSDFYQQYRYILIDGKTVLCHIVELNFIDKVYQGFSFAFTLTQPEKIFHAGRKGKLTIVAIGFNPKASKKGGKKKLSNAEDLKSSLIHDNGSILEETRGNLIKAFTNTEGFGWEKFNKLIQLDLVKVNEIYISHK